MGCPISCSGGCPSCSYAEKGTNPQFDDEHTWKCHQKWMKWWKAHPEAKHKDYAGETAHCTCKEQ